MGTCGGLLTGARLTGAVSGSDAQQENSSSASYTSTLTSLHAHSLIPSHSLSSHSCLFPSVFIAPSSRPPTCPSILPVFLPCLSPSLCCVVFSFYSSFSSLYFLSRSLWLTFTLPCVFLCLLFLSHPTPLSLSLWIRNISLFINTEIPGMSPGQLVPDSMKYGAPASFVCNNAFQSN